jgi:hypothetical protein
MPGGQVCPQLGHALMDPTPTVEPDTSTVDRWHRSRDGEKAVRVRDHTWIVGALLVATDANSAER